MNTVIYPLATVRCETWFRHRVNSYRYMPVMVPVLSVVPNQDRTLTIIYGVGTVITLVMAFQKLMIFESVR
jgi:hypothetical protein